MVETPSPKPLPIIWGARAIARFLGRTERATFHALERGTLPGARKVGGRWCLSVDHLRQHFDGEGAA